MQARETQLLTLLAGQHQFVIPIFQRDYSWGGEECERLVKDVLAVADGPDGAIHFLGSVVWVGSESGDAVLQQRLVIDGQQRLTTCLLLLMALRDHLRQSRAQVAPADSPDALHNQYLLNPYVDKPELRSKLQLRRVDNEWLQHLLLDAPEPKDRQSQVPLNLACLRNLIAENDAGRVLKGIRRLMIVSVSLSPGQDNPQLIFESLNSTGVKLAQADLVRNYVLMGHSEQLQTTWYLNYWRPLEEAFGTSYRALFDSFLRDFLTLELRPAKPFKLGNVYAEFKHWYPAYLNRNENHDEAIGKLKRMARFGRYYCQFIIGPDDSPKIEARLARLRKLVDVAVSTVMVLYERMHHDKTLDSEDFCEAIDTLESYVFRRSVVGSDTRSGGTLFSSLASKIRLDTPLESLKARLVMMGRGKAFPSDEEFEIALTTGDMYNRRTSFYMLERLTNYGKEKSALDGLSIEHVMPRKAVLPEEWRAMLGEQWREIQQAWLHRLGNLTLTGFNSELHASPFLEKRDLKPGGYADSSIWLNLELAKLDRWTPVEMETRGKTMAKRALTIWSGLKVDDAAIKQAHLDDALHAASGKTRSDLKCDEVVRLWLDKLADFAMALGDDVTEVVPMKSIVFHQPTWFVELLPRANGIDMRFDCEASELAMVAAGVQVTAQWAWVANSAIAGTDGSLYSVNSDAKLEVACALIRRAYELVGDEV
ncbi:DUF262 domain-containing protein [Paucibacter sp. PLA-PC-4]|uniref:DUF262 domain-containing protein n=1 Tax=Paucibacter sp. PLA-PC-4 TaxID=2993655 RepID=UPI00224884F6|nr:DUF262 domain-containing protein [Paucibacter sp. PLA-PC-4]MCX2862586.1 DUF262 domain-containing protein [Paucibacter sp. PLA-PC-4]